MTRATRTEHPNISEERAPCAMIVFKDALLRLLPCVHQ